MGLGFKNLVKIPLYDFASKENPILGITIKVYYSSGIDRYK
jgi:hypothetical protein